MVNMASISLSKEIIFGTRVSVFKLIEAGANVNEKDAYGLTPLIEATLKADLEIAEHLLAHGAKIDQQDVSGQTALQWAVNRNQKALSELFLRHKADPNHHSSDGQPLLVNPVLREQKELVDLLIDNGAVLNFAEDFINAKLIGHRFELAGRARILSPKKMFIELSYEGFFLEFTVGMVAKTLQNYMMSAAGQHYKAYETVLSKIVRTLKASASIIPYKYTTDGPTQHEAEIKRILNQDLAVIPVSYEGHAITFIKYGNLLAKCDRGVKHIVDTVVIYQVGNVVALNADFLKDLMYNNKSNTYINTELPHILNLKPIATLPPRYQLSGNCSWANVEASVPAMMFMLMFRGNLENRGEIATLKKSIMDYYDTWVEWDKDRVLHEWLSGFDILNTPQRVSRVSVLAAILFQRCRPSRPKEVERAKIILKLLMQPQYIYILNSYIKVYYTKLSGKLGRDFMELLRACGYR
jgi:hypothetical protein